MGGGDQSGSNPQLQQLLDLQRRQQLAASFTQGLQGIGAAVGRQQPYMPAAGPGPVRQPPGVGAGAGQIASPTGPALGPLFPGAGGGGGINEAQLAEILRQLGYAGQAV
jgi:hypothetical protein